MFYSITYTDLPWLHIRLNKHDSVSDPRKITENYSTMLCTLQRETCTIRECAAVLGSLVAAEPGVDFAPLYYKRTEQVKVTQLQRHAGDFEATMTIPQVMREDPDMVG